MPNHDDLLDQQFTHIAQLLDNAHQALRDSPHQARAFAEEALATARLTNNHHHVASCLEFCCRLYIQLPHTPLPQSFLSELLELRQRMDDRQGETNALLLMGQHQWHNGQVRIAATKLTQALELARNINYVTGQTDALESLARFHTDIGDYVAALDWYLQLLQFVAAHDPVSDVRAGVISNIGALYGQMENYDAALEQFTQALAMFAESGNLMMQARTAGNIAAAHHALHQNDQALEHGLRSLTLYRILGYQRDIPRLMMTIASILEEQGEFASAFDYMKRAMDGLDDRSDEEGYIGVLLGLGRLHRKTNTLHQGIYLIEEALRIAQARNLPHLEYRAHELLAEAFEELHDTARALGHYKQFAQIRDQLQSIEKQKAIATLHLRFDVERAQQELQILRLQSQQLQSEAAQKERELRAIALSLVERNQFIEGIRIKLTQIAANDSHTPSEQENLKSLIRQLHDDRNPGQAWTQFEDQFEQVHHGFMPLLAQRFPDLSPTERKVSALIRSGLSSKEIANLLHIDYRSVEQYRFRIRKKLRVPTETSLTTYMAAL
jgi:tetratricopeptide (TPR) repeat protein/DNA-binding CsgD family transcriptional regulator